MAEKPALRLSIVVRNDDLRQTKHLPPLSDLDWDDIPYRRFLVLPPDPLGFDRDKDGIGCEG